MTTLLDWYKRLGHLGYNNLQLLKTKNLVLEINFKDDKEIFCEACLQEKQHRISFPISNNPNVFELLELIYFDIYEPIKTTSINNKRYFITFINDKSRHIWTYILWKKNKAFDKFKEFKALVENFSGKRIKILWTNNKTEYLSNIFQDFLKKCEI